MYYIHTYTYRYIYEPTVADPAMMDDPPKRLPLHIPARSLLPLCTRK